MCPYIQQYSKVGCPFSHPLCLDKIHSRYHWTALEIFLHSATSGHQQNVGEESFLKIQTLTHNQTTEKDLRRSAKLGPMYASVKRNQNHKRDRGMNKKWMQTNTVSFLFQWISLADFISPVGKYRRCCLIYSNSSLCAPLR